MNRILNRIGKLNAATNGTFKARTIALSVTTVALFFSTPLAQAGEVPPFPGNRIGGVTRSMCKGIDKDTGSSTGSTQTTTQKPFFTLTALVPEKDVINSTKTTAEKPIVWVYMPYAKSLGHTFTLELRVTDPKGDSLSREIALPENPGIMPIFLPADAKFEVGQSYGWGLRANCGTTVSSFDIQLTIDRVAAQPQSTAGDPAENFTPYDRNGIWLNAISEVIKLNGKKPTLTPDAQKFLIEKLAGEDLKSLDPKYLQKLAEQPIVR